MLSDAMKNMLIHYEKGMELYKARNFQEAKSSFEKCLELVPEDGPSKLYVERCEQYLETPPPDDWDGVYTMTTK